LTLVAVKTATASEVAQTSKAEFRKIRSMAAFPRYSIRPVDSTPHER
jgi:hypothetical protein